MLKRILIALVTLVAGFFAIGYVVIPAERVVARSIAVKAAPADVYAQVANLKNWDAWAPWSSRRFAGAQVSYDGPETGVGAVMVWQSKDGGGKLWLTQGDPNSGISYEMWMRGDQRKSTGTIQLVPNELETLVVWTWRARFDGPLERWMGLPLDETLGPQFEAGLIELKKVVEANGGEELAKPVAVTPPPASPSGDSSENPEKQAADEPEHEAAPISQGESNDTQGGGEAASEDPALPVAMPAQ